MNDRYILFITKWTQLDYFPERKQNRLLPGKWDHNSVEAFRTDLKFHPALF